MKNYFLGILTIIVLLISSCVSVDACWCRKVPEETNTEEKYRKKIEQLVNFSDFVFSGMLVEENDDQLTFKVENSWKGDAKDKITFSKFHKVKSNGEREYFIDSCNKIFEVGKNYLVYADVTLNGLEVSKCGRSDFLTNAQRDVDELNRQKTVSTTFNLYNSHESYLTSSTWREKPNSHPNL
jgi:hypothetical protein